MIARPSFRPAPATLLALALATLPVAAAETPAPLAPRTVAEAAPIATEAGVLRRLPSIGRDTRLVGETDALAFPIWLTAAEVAAAPRLRLAHVAAVSVMPEASNLTVIVNGRPITAVAITATGASRSVEIALPAGALVPGWNAVRIEAQQRHRVECSLAATWELWTEIDRARSGLVFADGWTPDRRGLADLAAVAPDERGRAHIVLVAPTELDPRRFQRALRLTEAIALAGGFLDPIVTVSRTLEPGPGLHLLVGRDATGLLDARRAAVAGGAGTVTLFDDTDPSRLVLAVPNDDDAGIDRIVADLVARTEPSDGSEAGRTLRAALGGRAVASGERLTLADLGLRSTEFSGRLFRTGFDLRLPADLWAADYAKVAVRLAGGHAAGLDRASRLTIRVNGRQAAGVPIVAPHGEVFTDRTLQVPLSAFRPGPNRVEIEATLADASDRICDPAAQIDGAERFLLIDRTEIVFPTFARIARLPDLAATGAGVLGELAPELRPILFVPRPDAGTLAAAATFQTRVAVAAGRIDVPPVAFRNPTPDTPSATVVGAFSDLPATIAGAVGLEPGPVRDAWSRPMPDPRQAAAAPTVDRTGRRLASPRPTGSAETVDPMITGSLQTRALPALAPAADADLVDRWRRSVESPWSPAAVGREIAGRLGRFADVLPGVAARPHEAFTPTPSTGLVVAQAASATGGVWTLITAPTAAALAETTARLTEGRTWGGLAGAVTAWDRVDEKVSTVTAGPLAFHATRDTDPRNLRLVAAAWASETPLGFVLALIVAATLLGIATTRLLPHLGRAR